MGIIDTPLSTPFQLFQRYTITVTTLSPTDLFCNPIHHFAMFGQFLKECNFNQSLFIW